MYKKFRLFYAPADDGGLGTSEPLDQSQADKKQDEQQEQQKQENIKTYTQEDITKLQVGEPFIYKKRYKFSN